MPRSRRNKIVHLTQVKKKPKANKDKLIDNVREAASKFKYAYIVSAENQTSDFLRQTRELLRPGRMFFGKVKVMQLALGLHPSVECEEGIHKLAIELNAKQQKGLLFTDTPAENLDKTLEEFQPEDFARPGALANREVKLSAGTDALQYFPASMEVQLRQLGLPTHLKDGVIHLMGDYTVCQEGKSIDVNHCQLLKLLGEKMTVYRMFIDGCWSKEEGTFENLVPSDEEDDEEIEMGEEEEE